MGISTLHEGIFTGRIKNSCREKRLQARGYRTSTDVMGRRSDIVTDRQAPDHAIKGISVNLRQR